MPESVQKTTRHGTECCCLVRRETVPRLDSMVLEAVANLYESMSLFPFCSREAKGHHIEFKFSHCPTGLLFRHKGFGTV